MIGNGFRRVVAAAAVLGLAAAAAVVLSPLAGASSEPRLSQAQIRTHAACPAGDRSQLISTATGSDGALVPPGARQVLLCRYSGLNPTPADAGRLVAHRLIGYRQAIARLSGEFDALKPFQPGSYACPADFGVKIIAIFRYLAASRSVDPVTLDPNGCAGVTNGRLVRTAILAPGPSLIGQLEALRANGH